jgi:hypothetical protein
LKRFKDAPAPALAARSTAAVVVAVAVPDAEALRQRALEALHRRQPEPFVRLLALDLGRG